MDVKPSSALAGLSASSGTNKIELTSLDQLNLKPQQNYRAKVVAELLSVPTSNANASTPAVRINQRESILQAAGQEAIEKLLQARPVELPSRSEGEKQWLLQIQGKLILISSSDQLKAGQELSLSLSQTSDNQTASLKFAPIQSVDTAKLIDALGRLSPTALDAALQNMAKLMPQQISLAGGLNQINALATDPESPQSTQISARIISQALEPLIFKSEQLAPLLAQISKMANPNLSNSQTLDGLQSLISKVASQPAEKQTAPAKTSNANTSPQAIEQNAAKLAQQLLQNSGLIMEQRLLQSNEGLSTLKQVLATQQLLSKGIPAHSGNAQTKQTTSPAQSTASTGSSPSTMLATTPATTPATTSSAALDTRMASISEALFKGETSAANTSSRKGFANDSTLLQGIKQALSSALQANKSTAPDINQPVSTDLKQQLLALLSQPPAGSKDANTKPETTVETALLRNAMDFPHLQSLINTDQGRAKAEAILQDQNLSTGQLLKLMASMLNRIQFNQLNSLYQGHTASADGNPTQTWLFELPIQHHNGQIHPFSLRLEHEKKQSKDQAHKENNKEKEWRLSLAFDLPGLGPLFIQAQLNDSRIQPSIWSENPETLKLIRDEQNVLRQQLENLGLTVEPIQCHSGMPRQDKRPIQHHFVDTRA